MTSPADEQRPPRPTPAQFFQVARRPKWIAALILCLGVAAAFAALGQWQMDRSFQTANVVESPSETVLPLTEVATPQSSMVENTIGQKVTVTATIQDGDFDVLTGRVNEAGEPVSWLIGHAVTDAGNSLVVAFGWADSADDARAAASHIPVDAPMTVAGRYLAPESPEVDDLDKGEHRALNVGEQINLWQNVSPVYAGYVALADAPEGLTAIHQPPPKTDTSLNWLNVFYAIEWIIFAAFAIYLWYRVVRDVFEAEEEERTATAAASAV